MASDGPSCFSLGENWRRHAAGTFTSRRAHAPRMGFSGPSQPPLLPSSQPPERLRFMEKETSPEARHSRPRAEKNQILWFLLILGVFGLVGLGAILVNWLLTR